MDLFVFLAVLFAAACHAGWNASIKWTLDPLATTVLIATCAGVVAVPAMPFAGMPAPASWPWLIASLVIHVFYFAALIESYQAGDLGQVYPIARGSAPLMTGLAATLIVNETLGLAAWSGIVLLAAGVLLLSLRGGRDIAALDWRAVRFALLTAVTICAYSIVDGIGARLAGPGNAGAYACVLFIGNAILVLSYGVARRGVAIFPAMQSGWKMGLIGGALTTTSYSVAIWAMTLAPIAIVAALRETSVLFGALFAVVFLKEPVRASRIVAAVMIVFGLVLIRI
jgi:drug/metabolite transporter (DMT)-like permease